MKWSELITDPSSGQASMSRLAYGVIVVGILAITFVMVFQGKLRDVADLLKTALITTAGIYASNSVTGAVARKGEPQAEPKEGGPVG